MPDRYYMHKPTQEVRRLSGQRGDVLHFAQCIKRGGITFYWSSAADCEYVGEKPESFQVSISRLINRAAQRAASGASIRTTDGE